MNYIKLLRPTQWYKNFLVFLPLIFSGNLLEIQLIINSIIAFVSFCAISSSTYIINDYIDRNKDKIHPEKYKRPIASGKVSTISAALLTLALIIISVSTAIKINIPFLLAVIGYFALSQLYTFWLKHEAFADIITIAVNFVIRAVAGALAISVWVSPWLVAGVFFLALFLLLGKRKSEVMLLQRNAEDVRKTLKEYTPEITNQLSTLATASLIISYTLYVFFGQHSMLYITLPVAIYTVFRYEGLVSTGHKIARSPEYVFTDKRMMIGMLIWTALTIIVLYWDLFPK